MPTAQHCFVPSTLYLTVDVVGSSGARPRILTPTSGSGYRDLTPTPVSQTQHHNVTWNGVRCSTVLVRTSPGQCLLPAAVIQQLQRLGLILLAHLQPHPEGPGHQLVDVLPGHKSLNSGRFQHPLGDSGRRRVRISPHRHQPRGGVGSGSPSKSMAPLLRNPSYYQNQKVPPYGPAYTPQQKSIVPPAIPHQ
jgi:hypothetical protein